MITDILVAPGPVISTVTLALIHSLWQGLLIGLLTASLLPLLGNASARTRYAIACTSLAAIIAVTAATALALWPDSSDLAGPVPALTDRTFEPTGQADLKGSMGSPADPTDSVSRRSWWADSRVRNSIFLVWVAGVMLLSAYHLAGWHRARGFTRHGISPVPPRWQQRFRQLRDELKVTRAVSLLASSVVKVPCVVSWTRPVILAPVSLFTSLTPSEIEMILVHELAHVRRFDVLVNIMQTTVETLFFFNPAIWWLSRQIRIERENCCDDTVILWSGDGLTYARTLANLEELRMSGTGPLAALTGTPLERRIRRMVGATAPRLYSAVLSAAGLIIAASLLVVLLGTLGGSDRSEVQASEAMETTQPYDPQPGDLSGDWEVDADRDKVRFLVYGRRSSGMHFALDPVEVEPLVDLGRTSFQIVRDAGTLFLEGRLTKHRGNTEGWGSWHFRPDTAYMRFMSRHGLADDERQKTFSLAIFNISRAYVTEMEALGYHDLTIDQLISAGVQGISLAYIKAFRQLGYPDLTYQQLLSMRVQGVTVDDAREFQKLGFEHITPEQLISARIQNLSPGFVGSFHRAGFDELSFNSFIALHAFNLDVNDYRRCYRNRFMDLSQDNVVWVCGFGIERKDVERMQKLGYTDMDSIIMALREEFGR